MLNLGIEGIMLISAMTGFSAAYYSGDLWIGVAAAVLTGAALGLPARACSPWRWA